ncbi:hypothetical protein RU639_004553 [Aspergillus parasiticus]
MPNTTRFRLFRQGKSSAIGRNSDGLLIPYVKRDLRRRGAASTSRNVTFRDLYLPVAGARHIGWLKEVVPADRLVFFSVKDGWGPLCTALGKEVPNDIPFPRINDSKAIDRVAEYHMKRSLVRWLVVFTVVGVLSAWWFMRV